MGTADYIAPEQLERLPLTGAADVFALGCVLHVALSGGYPFAGRSRQQRMRARLTDPPLPLPEQVPAELSALVFRCLAREPGQRPTAAALERAFVELLVRFEPAVAPCDDNRSAGVPAARTVDLGAFAGGLGRRLAGARHKLLRIGREGEALVELDDILAVEPDLDVALSLRALALVRLWNRSHSAAADERNALAEKATQAVADARARAAHLADTHLADALIADYAGDTAYAVRALRRAHAHEPLHAFSHEVLGRIELEGCVGGVDRLLLAHELDPRQLGALSVVAREYFFTGRDDEAHALLARLESSRQWNNLEAMTMQLRLCLWRRDAGTAQELLRKAPKAGVIAVQLLFDCAAALGGAFSAVELAERAAHAVDQSMTSKRKSFVHQLAAEGLAALSPDEALCHVVSAARLPLSDLRWLDACPALAPLRRAPPFVEARAAVQERVDRAFALPAVSGSPDRDTRAATVRVVDAAAPTTTSGVFARLSPTVKTPSSRPSRPSRPSRTPRSGRTARTVKTDPPRR
jgi:hypothetical protein